MSGAKGKLTHKQDLVIEEVVEGIKQGRGAQLTEAHRKIYNMSTRNGDSVAAAKNWQLDYFREALIQRLRDRNVLGPNGKLENRLAEGLDAEDGEGTTDYNARLRYIQEINKIVGAYAPKKVEKRSATLSVDVTGRELDKKIEQLQAELDT